jgi:hypothetical protein
MRTYVQAIPTEQTRPAGSSSSAARLRETRLQHTAGEDPRRARAAEIHSRRGDL